MDLTQDDLLLIHGALLDQSGPEVEALLTRVERAISGTQEA